MEFRGLPREFKRGRAAASEPRRGRGRQLACVSGLERVGCSIRSAPATPPRRQPQSARGINPGSSISLRPTHNKIMLNSGNSERLLLNASWLIKLRWVAVFGQLLTIGGAIALFQLKLPLLWPLWTVIALTAISNGIFQLIFGRMSRLPLEQQPPWNLLLGLLMVMDILSLTSLLFASGGPTNPFCLFFFVNLSLSALAVEPRLGLGPEHAHDRLFFVVALQLPPDCRTGHGPWRCYPLSSERAVFRTLSGVGFRWSSLVTWQLLAHAAA